MIQSQLIDITLLETNKGQIEGLPSNPRFIKDESFKSLVKSLKEDPDMLELREVIAYPIAKNRYVVLGGNQRLMAGLELRFTEMPVKVVPADTSLDKLKRIVIKDNGSWGNHDFDLLANEWSELPLSDWGIDLPEDWLQEPETIPAEEEEFNGELPKEPITVLGDLYELNGHRVLCGDSTDSDAVARLMDGKKADMVFTDPPYGINIGNQSQGKGGGVAKKIDYGVNDWDKTIPYEAINQCFLISDNIILWGANYYADKLPPSSCWIVWDKENGDTDFADCELAWTSYEKAARLVKWKWAGMIQQDMKNKEQRIHPTQKPAALAEWTFEKFNAGKLIADIFLGSGSTLMASEKTDRICYGQEMGGNYCDAILQRWVKYMRDNNRPYTVKRNGQTLSEEQINEYFPQ